MRCKTLADELRTRGAEVKFVCREQPGNLISLLREAGYTAIALPATSAATSLPEGGQDDYASWLGVEQTIDAAQSIEAIGDSEPDWLVVDHYGLDVKWEQLLRPRVRRIFVVDDLANRSHDCDLLLDQNYYAGMKSRYTSLVPANTKQLLGPSFALLRPGFRKARESLRQRDGVVRQVLVFFGGVDPTRETEKVLEALRGLNHPGIAVEVVVGGNNPRAVDIRIKCRELPNVMFHQQVMNMAEIMSASDFSIGAGGTTHWERCCVGLPTAVTVVAENQSNTTCDIAAEGVVLALGSAAQVEPARYREILESVFDGRAMGKLLALQSASLALVDGRGTDRVILSMHDEPVQLRRATGEDAEKAWRWRNHACTRKYSLNQRVVPYAEHLTWWNRSLNDASRILLIGNQCGLEIGVLRYDFLMENKAVVSVYLDPELHRLGLGVAILEAGNKWIMQNCPEISELHAQIFQENEASKRAFEAVGFQFRRGYWILNTNQMKFER